MKLEASCIPSPESNFGIPSNRSQELAVGIKRNRTESCLIYWLDASRRLIPIYDTIPECTQHHDQCSPSFASSLSTAISPNDSNGWSLPVTCHEIFGTIMATTTITASLLMGAWGLPVLAEEEDGSKNITTHTASHLRGWPKMDRWATIGPPRLGKGPL